MHGEAFRGYIACKKRLLYGLRVHLLMTTDGLPVEVLLAPGSQADIRVFRCFGLELPPKAYIFADAGYLDQHEEALLKEAAQVHLVAGSCRHATWLRVKGLLDRAGLHHHGRTSDTTLETQLRFILIFLRND